MNRAAGVAGLEPAFEMLEDYVGKGTGAGREPTRPGDEVGVVAYIE